MSDRDLTPLLALVDACASRLTVMDGEPAPDVTAARQTLNHIRMLITSPDFHTTPDPKTYLKHIDDQVVLFQQQLAEVQLTLVQTSDHEEQAHHHIKAYQKNGSY